ncbi:MAG: DNA translocase FtsK 4TM domain-containing protein [Desulfobacteraceae bacterium]|nr:DNA translocase FtsK 4TM domain-containing protein [Desulfobacteraceae bacterium]
MDRKKHEIWALCVLTCSLLLLFSIFSYSSQDRTIFNASSASATPHNLVGSFGAHLAWPFMFLLGIGSYGLVFAGVWASRRLFKGEGFDRAWVLFMGITLLILSVMTFFALHWPKFSLWGQTFETGGKLGTALAMFLDSRFYPTGSHILLIGVFFIALLMATPLTISATYEWLARAWGALLDRIFRSEEQTEESSPESPVDDDERPRPQRPKKEKTAAFATVPTQMIMKTAARKETELHMSVPDSPGQYVLPPTELLDVYETETSKPDWKRLEQSASVLEEKLADFGVQGKVVGINPGPVITMFEYAPAPGIKISRVVGLADDLSMALKAISIRVAGPIPGKAAIGIEVPNQKRELVSVRAVFEADIFTAATLPLTMALGKDTYGKPVVANLGRMPHLLIAGATGTGKSVCLNTVLCSLLYRNTPEDLRLLLIDPKRIELSTYEGIPQLIHPVVTDAKVATRALRWAVEEMELRYRLLEEKKVRNIEDYNRVLAKERSAKPKGRDPDEEPPAESELPHHRLPYVVIVMDELADLMMVASREVEESITRLAQKARAAGIHLILATQRPSVDVITGIIKANISTRISFQVSSKIDSRTILDGSGAEALLGSGDMLFLAPGTAKLQRIHGAFISDGEVTRVTDHWKAQKLLEDPLKERVDLREDAGNGDIDDAELDAKYDEAVDLVLETRQASISMIQRRLRVGYNRAARMIEVMEQQGIVSPSDGVKPREVLGRRK